MKKVTLIAMLFMISLSAFSQEETKPKKNELKINLPYLIGGIPEIGYEYLINNESGVGIDLLFSIDKDTPIDFALTTYYRIYFGEKPTAGFFVEGFGMLNTAEGEEYYDIFDSISHYETDFALGVSVGGKFMTNKGVIFEICGGVGRNLFNERASDIIPRMGLTIGKRF